jgi:hypothetical protein
MRVLSKLHYEMQHLVARISAPVLRQTGYRFSKNWRGNPLINHVEANSMADGIAAKDVKCRIRR